eukprot:scaffold279774_cov51-Attheya_sp.AAC.1
MPPVHYRRRHCPRDGRQDARTCHGIWWRTVAVVVAVVQVLRRDAHQRDSYECVETDDPSKMTKNSWKNSKMLVVTSLRNIEPWHHRTLARIGVATHAEFYLALVSSPHGVPWYDYYSTP